MMNMGHDSGPAAGKKKVLVLVDWFAPGYKAGGPIQSCVNFSFALRDDFDVYVLTTDTDHGEHFPYEGIPTGKWITNLHPDIHVNYLPKKTMRLSQLRREIETVDPDYLFINQMFSPMFAVYPLWLKYIGKLKAGIVLCPRGALYDSALSVKPLKKKLFLRLFNMLGIQNRILFHATNEREKTAIQRIFPGSTVRIADNLPNSRQPPFLPCPKQTGALKTVFVARIVPIKNLLFLLQTMRDLVAATELTIIGPPEDPGYWEECRDAIGRLPPHIRATYIGPKRNDELLPLLHQHHLFVLPTTGENFGHSIFEAFLAGRPVLISDQTPWVGLENRRVGWDLPLSHPRAFTEAMEKAAAWDQTQFDEWAESAWSYAHDFIKNPDLQSQYLKLFE